MLLVQHDCCCIEGRGDGLGGQKFDEMMTTRRQCAGAVDDVPALDYSLWKERRGDMEGYGLGDGWEESPRLRDQKGGPKKSDKLYYNKAKSRKFKLKLERLD